MTSRIYETAMPVSQERLFNYHALPGAFGRLVPPYDPVRLLQPHPGIHDGARVHISKPLGPLKLKATFEHFGCNPPHVFCDRQIDGPFAFWEHHHRCLPGPTPTSSLLRDELNFRVPMGALGSLLGGSFIASQLDRLFTFRHARTLADLNRVAWWNSFASAPRRVCVSGSSGSIGGTLCDVLSTAGTSVLRLVRTLPSSGAPDDQCALWRPPDGDDPGEVALASLEGVESVVHLAGEPVAIGRWTDDKKHAIRNSRVEGTRLLARSLASLQRPPKVLIVASGIGYYGERGEEEVTEETGVGSGFLTEVARDWEAAAEPARQAGIRVVHLRIGAVIGANGGLLQMINPLFKLGLGGILGSGHQWLSWIGLDDTITAIMLALAEPSLQGPVNVVSPHPVRVSEFASTLAGVHRQGLFARLPASMVKLCFGEKAGVLMESCRAQPTKLRRSHMPFFTPLLESAIQWELGNSPVSPPLITSAH